MLVLPPLGWRRVECAIHHERDVRKDNTHISVARTSNYSDPESVILVNDHS